MQKKKKKAPKKKPAKQDKKAKKAPSPNGDGRDPKTGQFLPGNPGGPGNPHGRKTEILRSAIMEAITPEDIQAAVEQLVLKARTGDLPAIRELLDRAAGRPGQSIEQTIKDETGIDFSKMDGKQIKAHLRKLWEQMPDDVKGSKDAQLENPRDAGNGSRPGGGQLPPELDG